VAVLGWVESPWRCSQRAGNLPDAKTLREGNVKLPRRKFLYLAAGGASLPAISRFASAQTYPTRPITMVVPFPAGGGGDLYGRVFAARLSELLGQQVVVENVPGTGGMVGAARVARAAPDGYTLLLASAGTHAYSQSIYKAPLYNAATDFAPVALLAEQPLVLITRKDLPANKLQEFIAYAKANQAKMQYGSDAGVGSANHLVCLLLNSAIGINVTHVPYRGGALPDLMAGRIDYLCPLVSPNITPHVANGAVKALTILSRKRTPILSNVPSAREQGLTDFEGNTWFAFFLPKGTPAPIVQRLHGATVSAMDSPVVQEKLTQLGAELVAPEHRSPEYLQRFVVSEIEKWKTTIKAAGVRPE
jgi:tripartite-type tricarboxylate transporter receptor subunit TctC